VLLGIPPFYGKGCVGLSFVISLNKLMSMNDSFLPTRYPLWTQEEAIAFECAQEVLTHLSAICTARIYDEQLKASPDLGLIDTLRSKQVLLRQKRDSLTVDNQEKIAKIRREYGAEVRAWNAQTRAA
jgi:hypothetical protein